MLDGGKGAVGGEEGGAGAGGGGGEVLESGRDSATVLLKIITPYQVSIFDLIVSSEHDVRQSRV